MTAVAWYMIAQSNAVATTATSPYAAAKRLAENKLPALHTSERSKIRFMSRLETDHDSHNVKPIPVCT